MILKNFCVWDNSGMWVDMYLNRRNNNSNGKWWRLYYMLNWNIVYIGVGVDYMVWGIDICIINFFDFWFLYI